MRVKMHVGTSQEQVHARIYRKNAAKQTACPDLTRLQLLPSEPLSLFGEKRLQTSTASGIFHDFLLILHDSPGFSIDFHRFSIVFHGLQWFSYRIPGVFVLNRLRPGRDRQVQRDTSELRTSLEDAETEVQRVRRLSCGTWTGDGYGWI